VASHEAMDVLHQVMRLTTYCPGGMVIEIVANLATFFYIVDYKISNYSFMLTIYLNCFDRVLTQPLVRIALELDWVQLSNLCH